MSTTDTDRFRAGAEKAAKGERRIQEKIDADEARSFQSGDEDDEKPMQAGAREYPAPPLPEQHLKKPGEEASLALQPMWDAPFYKGSGKLAGKVALITGADSGIGRAVAVLFAREGADIAIAYLDEDEDAQTTKKAVEAEGGKAILISGDVADPGFATLAVERTVAELADRLLHDRPAMRGVLDVAGQQDGFAAGSLDQAPGCLGILLLVEK